MLTYSLDNLRDADDPAPLFFKYPRQCNPQPAHVELDHAGRVTADSSGEIGNGVPFHVWHRRTLRFRVDPCVGGAALADYLEGDEGRALLERIHTGHTVEWDGSNHVGMLDEDAEAAKLLLEQALMALDCVVVWNTDEWIGPCPFGDLWPAGKTLARAVADLEAEAKGMEHVLDGDVTKALLDRAQTENDRGRCNRADVLAALRADGRPVADDAIEGTV